MRRVRLGKGHQGRYREKSKEGAQDSMGRHAVTSLMPSPEFAVRRPKSIPSLRVSLPISQPMGDEYRTRSEDSEVFAKSHRTLSAGPLTWRNAARALPKGSQKPGT